MAPDDELHLVTGGLVFAGWKRVSLRRSMVHCADRFDVGAARLPLDRDPAASSVLRPGGECSVTLEGDAVLSGYVDVLTMEMDDKQHDVRVTGRSKTADLVDCSAIRKAGQWAGLRVEQIAAELAGPFGVSVIAAVDTGKPLSTFALQEGETVFDAINRAARLRGLLLMTDTAGRLVITRAGIEKTKTRLVLGENILSIRVEQDMRDRYSRYIVKGQAPGSDYFNGPDAAHVKAEAEDAAVKRYRPLIVTADAPDVAATHSQRAKWEANTRAARSLDVQITVQGWKHSEGLWSPNLLVPVYAEAMRLYAELLLVDVDYIKDERGTLCRLSLTRSDAFNELQPAQPKNAGAFWDAGPSQAGAVR